jgi:hypothetical protein
MATEVEATKMKNANYEPHTLLDFSLASRVFGHSGIIVGEAAHSCAVCCCFGMGAPGSSLLCFTWIRLELVHIFHELVSHVKLRE